MSHYLTSECFGCGSSLSGEPGMYYCDSCIAEQTKEYEEERQTFDDYHAFADEVARRTR